MQKFSSYRAKESKNIWQHKLGWYQWEEGSYKKILSQVALRGTGYSSFRVLEVGMSLKYSDKMIFWIWLSGERMLQEDFE